MTTVDSALHSVQRESEVRRDPREVFREFLDHLGHLGHLGRAARRGSEKPPKANGRRSAGKP